SPRPKLPESARAGRATRSDARIEAMSRARASRVYIVTSGANLSPRARPGQFAYAARMSPGSRAIALFALTACAQAPIVTTNEHKAPDHAPPPPDTDVRDTTGNATLSGPADPAERIVFLKGGSVWIMSAEGGEPLRVAGSAKAEESPVLSPRGDRVAFVSR